MATWDVYIGLSVISVFGMVSVLSQPLHDEMKYCPPEVIKVITYNMMNITTAYRALHIHSDKIYVNNHRYYTETGLETHIIVVQTLHIRSHTSYVVGVCPTTLASIEKRLYIRKRVWFMRLKDYR